MPKLPTWNDLKDATPKELMRVYKLSPRQLENAHRKHLYGANATERRAEYDQLYRKNRG
jgi:hypothetical protein